VVLGGLAGPLAHAEVWRRATVGLVRPLKAGAGGWLFERV
jgi:hypothetical protein